MQAIIALVVTLMIPTTDRETMKQLLKEALAETLDERRDLLHEVLAEVLKDFSLAKAIRERQRTDQEIIAAVLRMDEDERQNFLEDLLAATSPAYLGSICEARQDYEAERVSSHEDLFGK